MKTKFLFLTFTLFLALSFINSKWIHSEPRNVLLEYVTQTTCGFCPCGDSTIRDILSTYPNTLVIAYHDGDAFSYFNGNNIISLMNFNQIPTADIDRGNDPYNYGYNLWYNGVSTEYNNNPNTIINMHLTAKNYNTTTRVLTATIASTALQTLTDQYYISYVITESGVVYYQSGFYGCPGGSNYVHRWICRNMVNGATGEPLNSGTWNQNQTITANLNTTIDGAWVANNCALIVFVYKYDSSLYMAAVQQGILQNVTDPIGINKNTETAEQYYLSQNYPNPFNPTTNIYFSLPKNGNVSLKIYDITGQVVQTYVDGFLKAGKYNAEVDGSNLASGVYFYTLKTAEFLQTKKMVLIK